MPRSSPVPDPRKVMKRIRLTGIGSWARGGGWRGLLGALVAISLLIEPIRTEQPAAAAGGGIRKWAARQVVAVRRSHGVDGTGVGIGVLSSGVATLMTGEAAGDLPDRVTVLPGQAGEGDEGTATLAILRDLAPGGDLYFATGLGGPARFAANLEALCRAGADVIVDDLFDYQETIHQGGLMAQAVRAAVRNGCVYVSARGNPVHSRVREGETAPDPPPMADDLSTTGDSAGTSAGLTGTTCVTAANPDFETFCVSSAPPPQVAAMVALTLEAAGGAHNTSLEELRAAVTGGRLGVAPTIVDSLSVDDRAIEGSSENAADLDRAGLPDQAGQGVGGVQPALVDGEAAAVSHTASPRGGAGPGPGEQRDHRVHRAGGDEPDRRGDEAGKRPTAGESRAADPVAAVGQGPPDPRPAEGEFAASGGSANPAAGAASGRDRPSPRDGSANRG